MHQGDTAELSPEAVARALRDELARADRALASVPPVLEHLLAAEPSAVLSDAIVAGVRGRMADLDMQLPSEAEGEGAWTAQSSARAVLLSHAHALAVEGLLLERLQATHAIDPVIPPLVGETMSGRDVGQAELAMQVLAAQARFMQHHRRMAMPLADLPAEVFHAAVAQCPPPNEADLRAGFAESRGRLALIARFVVGVEEDTAGALDLERAGVSLFASALALATGTPRDTIVATMATPAPARTALSLRAAGLSAPQIEMQLALLYADHAEIQRIDRLDPAAAGALLSPAAHGLGD